MLITDIEEVREYVSVNKSFDLENIAPYLDRAESKYIIPVLGDELYDYLNRLVNAEQSPDLTETQEKQIKKILRGLQVSESTSPSSRSNPHLTSTPEFNTFRLWSMAFLNTEQASRQVLQGKV